MSFFIYLILALICFVIAFFLIYSRLKYFYKYPENYDEDHDGHEEFLNVFFAKIHKYSKEVFVFGKLFYTNILHLWVRFIEQVKHLSEKLYMKSRDRFVKEVIKDKSTVPQFWSQLKKYKKEKDAEIERIDDDSMNFIKR